MDLKKSSITADILHVLNDGKIHTLQEIADEDETMLELTGYSDEDIQSLLDEINGDMEEEYSEEEEWEGIEAGVEA